MEEIKLIKPHHEGDSDLEVVVNGKKWKINIGETEKVPEFIATEVRRSIAKSDGLGLTDHTEAEPEESSGGVLVVHEVNGTLDKTWQEIYDASLVSVVVNVYADEYGTSAQYLGQASIAPDGTEYAVVFGETTAYLCSTANDYPAFSS